MKQRTAAPTPAMKDIWHMQPPLRFVRLPEEVCALPEEHHRRLIGQPLRLVPPSDPLYSAQRALLQWLGDNVEHAELCALCKELSSCGRHDWFRKRATLFFSGFDLFSPSIDVM